MIQFYVSDLTFEGRHVWIQSTGSLSEGRKTQCIILKGFGPSPHLVTYCFSFSFSFGDGTLSPPLSVPSLTLDVRVIGNGFTSLCDSLYLYLLRL